MRNVFHVFGLFDHVLMDLHSLCCAFIVPNVVFNDLHDSPPDRLGSLDFKNRHPGPPALHTAAARTPRPTSVPGDPPPRLRRTGQNGAEHDRTEHDRTWHDRTPQSMTKHARTEQ